MTLPATAVQHRWKVKCTENKKNPMHVNALPAVRQDQFLDDLEHLKIPYRHQHQENNNTNMPLLPSLLLFDTLDGADGLRPSPIM